MQEHVIMPPARAKYSPRSCVETKAASDCTHEQRKQTLRRQCTHALKGIRKFGQRTWVAGSTADIASTSMGSGTQWGGYLIRGMPGGKRSLDK